MSEPVIQELTGDVSQANKGRFVKGDPRINRRGRPKSFDAVRKLVQKLANEDLIGEDGTLLEKMLRAMLASPNAADRANILAYGWGKVKDEVETTGETVIRVEYVQRSSSPTNPTP